MAPVANVEGMLTCPRGLKRWVKKLDFVEIACLLWMQRPEERTQEADELFYYMD